MSWWKNQKLYIKILIGVILGIIVGLIFGEKVLFLSPIGDIFLRLLQVIVVPVVFFSLISGMTQLENIEKLKSIGLKTVFFYAVTGLIATVIGVCSALYFAPGKHSNEELHNNLNNLASAHKEFSFNFIDNIIEWVPRNAIESMASGNMLQIIIFTVLVGIALLSLGERGKKMVDLFHIGADMSIRLAGIIISFAPYGIFALMATATAKFGGDFILQGVRYVLSDLLGMVILLVVVYPILIALFTRFSPFSFYKKVAPAMIMAASTTSSNATLPTSMTVAREGLRIPESIYGFTLPLGATINMNGMSVVLGVIAVFAANVHGVDITLEFLVTTIFLGIFLAAGTAGVKGADIVMASVLLTTLGFPLTLLPIIAALSPLLDMGHTICNITGDLVGTAIVDKIEDKKEA
ncbi:MULTISPECIES: dicarboxylate/amino acid:cation symporter [Acinetobacter calcoaceticus/baumannii complex]|uniref:dicarboxylate/amino acid:cation symporter n=1 Tax=Acinetobacter calcoaceticus/baumannii complex TaxID=909768 RepID=UPI0002BB7A04|nr:MULTISPECIES: dicarboxylate/amino acid:cation symporter [Acinetobacter calcoaceticus/baumannii complex]MDH2595925.1 dicarboxylate/amino acid:cation symporter [Acinetobacter baumannii]MDO7536700.1 dicarboxylate/amino acid:cation symporter [Acinetobacter pittii]